MCSGSDAGVILVGSVASSAAGPEVRRDAKVEVLK